MTDMEFYRLYKQAETATSKAKAAEAKAADLRAKLMAAMDDRNVERVHYESDGGAHVVNRKTSIMVDAAKVKAAFPDDWTTRFGQSKAGCRYVVFDT